MLVTYETQPKIVDNLFAKPHTISNNDFRADHILHTQQGKKIKMKKK